MCTVYNIYVWILYAWFEKSCLECRVRKPVDFSTIAGMRSTMVTIPHTALNLKQIYDYDIIIFIHRFFLPSLFTYLYWAKMGKLFIKHFWYNIMYEL